METKKAEHVTNPAEAIGLLGQKKKVFFPGDDGTFREIFLCDVQA